jgi:RimJ/RimL family protein N-acetyltransferase
MNPDIVSHWADKLSIPKEVFYQEGVFVFEHQKEHRIIVYSRKGLSIIMCPQSRMTKLQSFAEQGNNSVSAEQIAKWVYATVAWRDYILYWDNGVPSTRSENIAALTSSNKKQLTALLARCSDKDKELGEVSLDDPVVLGYFNGDELAGVGSLLHENNNIADIGILVVPESRKQGGGKALTLALTHAAKENSKIPQYTTMEKNLGSVKVAESLGFQLYFIEEGIKLDSNGKFIA